MKKLKPYRGNTSHTPDIEKWKDTYVVDGPYLCILRELADGGDDLYWVLQIVHSGAIYCLTGVTSSVFLHDVIPDNSYNLLYVYDREQLDLKWGEWKSKYLSGE